MSPKKLTAGDGYTYLIRQVAAHDSTERGYDSLSGYYSEKGESPGRWWGSGLTSLGVSGEVSEAQMRALFGEGRHPDADAIETRLIREGYSATAAQSMTRLGQAFRLTEGSSEWQRRLARAYTEYNTAAGAKWDAAIPEAERARIRTEIAVDYFQDVYGRAPLDARELTGFVTRESRVTSAAVAGYDCTFSPVKSISALWAVAPIQIRDAIRVAHEAAVERTLAWMEQHIAYTRLGDGGPAQVETRGMLVAVFTHRDSRNGDPQLHTHAAISNKVQTLDGRWLALDGRLVYELAVSASETYNTAMEEEFTARLGGRFQETVSGSGRRPIRELVGVDPRLNALYSSRRAELVERREQLAQDFLAAHGRHPTPLEMISLAERANLETRQQKHEPRAATDQHQLWQFQAGQALNADPLRVGAEQVRAARLGLQAPSAGSAAEGTPITRDRVGQLAAVVVDTISQDRSTWQWRHVYAEAQRQLRTDPGLAAELRAQAVLEVVNHALHADYSIPIGELVDAGARTPAGLRRRDGSSVFTRIGGQKYTSARVIEAERRVLDAAGLTGGRVASQSDLVVAVLEWQANDTGRLLNSGQERLAQEMACSGQRVQLALAPAGTGKTTALGILASAWSNSGGEIVALAPQASAAHQLSTALGGAKADTLDKLVYEVTATPADQRPDWVQSIGPDSLVLIDEAGLASTRNLDVAISYILGRGGSVRLIGDDRQLGAVGAGGLLRDLQAEHGALTLTEVMRFSDKAEGAASLALRAGDPSALGYYLDRGRIHATTTDAVADQVFAAAQGDLAAGADVLMIAPDLQLVAALNARARAARLTREALQGREIGLSGGETASAGDLIITKKNRRQLSLGGTDHVRNNDRFTITAVHDDGSITALHTGLHRQVRLPSWYVKQFVRLGYAATLRSEQGDTVGTTGAGPAGPRAGITHTVITDRLGAAELYMGLTRGTAQNHAWVITSGDGEAHSVIFPETQAPTTAVEVLTTLLQREDENRSATTELTAAADPAQRLAVTAPAYRHAYNTAVTDLTGPDRLAELTARAEASVPGVTTSGAWDSLLAHLAGIDLTGADPISQLADVVGGRELNSAEDLAAVLDYRLDPAGTGSIASGPLPWLPALPAAVSFDPDYGPYLQQLATSIRQLVDQLTKHAADWTPATAPAWALPYLEHPGLVRQLTVWRAATGAETTDLRPAGRPGSTMAMRAHRTRLLEQTLQVSGVSSSDAAARWAVLINELDPRISADDSWPLLAGRLNTADALGINVDELVRTAFRRGPLPDERPADALWWRLAPNLSPTGAETPVSTHRARPPWSDRFSDVLGGPAAERIMADRLWPAIVARMDLAVRGGADPARLARDAAGMLAGHLADLSPAQLATAALWQLSLLADPEPLTDLETEQAAGVLDETTADQLPPEDADLILNELAAAELGPFADLVVQQAEPAAAAVATADLQAARQALVAAAAFFATQVPGSWVPDHLRERGLPDLQVGYAPAGWTSLVDQLRRHGHTDRALLDAGLAKVSSRGTLIDVFRDRLVLPITTSSGQIVSFLGRRNPAHDADRSIPKYLNGPNTDLYNKSALPYGLDADAAAAIAAGAPIVLVEGPFDHAAIRAAIPLSTAVPIAAAGTAGIAEHLQLLDSIGPLATRTITTAFDNDPAGRAAAIHAYQLLVQAGVTDPRHLDLPAGADPAQLLAQQGPAAIAEAIAGAQPLLDLVVDHHIAISQPSHPPANQFEQRLQTGQALWRTVERSLLNDGVLLPGPDIARQTQRIATALDRPLSDVVDALGACAFPDEWAGLDRAQFGPDYWLAMVEQIGEFAFYPHLGDTAEFADAEQILAEFREQDPNTQPLTDTIADQVARPRPGLREQYQAALADYIEARDAYYDQATPWHSAAAHELEQLSRRADALQPLLDAMQEQRAAILAADRAGDASGAAAAQQRLQAAEAALHAAQPGGLPTATAEPTGYADQAALRDLTGLHAHLLDLQAVVDAAVAAEPATRVASEQWQSLVAGIHPDLLTDPLYPALAEAIERAHQAGVDVSSRLRDLNADHPTRDARELLWRFYTDCEASLPALAAAADEIPESPPAEDVSTDVQPIAPAATGADRATPSL